MHITYNGAQSTVKLLPGGGPQGAYLGGIIFIIKYNGAFLRPPIPRLIQGPVNQARAEKVKFIDDGTIAVSVDLKSNLTPDPITRSRPHNFMKDPFISYQRKIIYYNTTSMMLKNLKIRINW